MPSRRRQLLDLVGPMCTTSIDIHFTNPEDTATPSRPAHGWSDNPTRGGNLALTKQAPGQRSSTNKCFLNLLSSKMNLTQMRSTESGFGMLSIVRYRSPTHSASSDLSLRRIHLLLQCVLSISSILPPCTGQRPIIFPVSSMILIPFWSPPPCPASPSFVSVLLSVHPPVLGPARLSGTLPASLGPGQPINSHISQKPPTPAIPWALTPTSFLWCMHS